MPESYFPLDVNFFDHPKIVGLSDPALRLYLSSVAYSNRLLTDGFIAHAIASRLIEWDWNDTDALNPERCAEELVRAVLWHHADATCPNGTPSGQHGTCPKFVQEGYRIHDFLSHNRSRAERMEARDKERDRKAAYRKRQQGDTEGQKDGGVPHGVPMGQDVAGTVNTETDTETDTETTKFNTIVEFGARKRAPTRPATVNPDDVRLVFDTWRKTTGKPRAKCDPKRTTRIVQALKTYPLDDVLDAVQGWRNSPHHCGSNDRGTVYNELELLLRDAAHIEQFRDLARDGPTPVLGKRTRQMVTTDQALAQWAAEGVNGNGQAAVGANRRPPQRDLAGPAD